MSSLFEFVDVVSLLIMIEVVILVEVSLVIVGSVIVSEFAKLKLCLGKTQNVLKCQTDQNATDF